MTGIQMQTNARQRPQSGGKDENEKVKWKQDPEPGGEEGWEGTRVMLGYYQDT